MQSEINNVVSVIASAKTAISAKNDDYQKAAELKYFKGDIAGSLKSANTRVKSRMTTLKSAYGTLSSKLTSLGCAVQKAEIVKQAGKNKLYF